MRNVFVALAVFMLASCSEKKGQSFIVNGVIKNVTADKVYLDFIELGTGMSKTADSADVKDGAFSLNTKAKEESLFYIRFDKEQYPFASVINDKPAVTIKGDMSDGGLSLQFEGSPASQHMKDFFVDNGNRWTDVQKIGNQIDSCIKVKAPDSVMAAMNARGEKMVGAIKSSVSETVESGSPVLAMLAMRSNQRLFTPDEYGALMNMALNKYPEHKGLAAAGKELEQQLAAVKQRNMQTQWTGKPAPEISLPDVNGSLVSLSSYKGKYVLVDFWASWCKPCRLENPNVVAAYNKFKDKNFTVLGVSLDDNEKAWKNAIQKDGLSWTHISDLKQWSSDVVPLYHINGIPFNVLVDPKGLVVAENLRGPELEAKLNQVLN